MTCKATFVFFACIPALSESSDSCSAQALIAGTGGVPPATQSSFVGLLPDYELAVSFSVAPGSAYTITQLQTAAFHYPNPNPLSGTSAVFSINEDSAGVPAAQLVTFPTDSITTTEQVLSLTPSHAQLVLPGNRYWLVGRTVVGQVNWIHGFNAFGEFASRSGTPWHVSQGSNIPAFALLGVAVPEPSALVLAGIGLGGALMYRRCPRH